jgi:drug/metabolite transporter (DMT)-like permease
LTDRASTAVETVSSGKLAGRLAMLVAALLWSTSGLFAKAPIFDDWPAMHQGTMFAFWRAFFAALVLLPTVRRPRWNGYLVPLAVCFVLMNVTYLTSMTQTTAANAIWLQNLAPWWVFLFSVLLFHEPIVRRDFIPLGFAVVGVSTILFFEVQGQSLPGVLCGLASGVMFAMVIVLMRQLRGENPAWMVALNLAVTALVLAPWMLFLGHKPSLAQLAVLLAFGALQMAIPYLFLVYALRWISSQEAVTIGLVEPILLPLWVFLVWGERPAWWTGVGALCILTGLVLRYVVWELVLLRRRAAA